MQKGSDCEKISDPVYFVFKFVKGVNYSYFHPIESEGSKSPLQKERFFIADRLVWRVVTDGWSARPDDDGLYLRHQKKGRGGRRRGFLRLRHQKEGGGAGIRSGRLS
jgi:hypothetical protein